MQRIWRAKNIKSKCVTKVEHDTISVHVTSASANVFDRHLSWEARLLGRSMLAKSSASAADRLRIPRSASSSIMVQKDPSEALDVALCMLLVCITGHECAGFFPHGSRCNDCRHCRSIPYPPFEHPTCFTREH